MFNGDIGYWIAFISIAVLLIQLANWFLSLEVCATKFSLSFICTATDTATIWYVSLSSVSYVTLKMVRTWYFQARASINRSLRLTGSRLARVLVWCFESNWRLFHNHFQLSSLWTKRLLVSRWPWPYDCWTKAWSISVISM